MKKQKLLTIATSTAIAAPLAAYAVSAVVTKAIQNNEINQKKAAMTGEITKRYLIIEDGVCRGIKPTCVKNIKKIIDDQIAAGQEPQLVFPSNIKLIAPAAFANAFSDVKFPVATNIKIKFSVTTQLDIDASAFAGCNKISSIGVYDPKNPETTPDIEDWELQSIGQDAFDYCTNLTSITIPKSCSKIGIGAFENCTNLKQIKLSDKDSALTSGIETSAFKNISSFGQLVVPNAMNNAEISAITSNLATPELGGLNFYNGGSWTATKESSNDPITLSHPIPTIYLNVDTNNKLYGGIKIGSISDYDSLYVPKNVESIEPDSFTGNTSFKDLNWEPDSKCTKIGARAFAQCTNLGELQGNTPTLTLPSKTTDIGALAFYETSKYEKIDLSKIRYVSSSRQLNIAPNAFKNWKVLESTESTYQNAVEYPTVEGSTTFQQQITISTAILLNQCGIDKTWFTEIPTVEVDAAQYAKVTYDSEGNISINVDWDEIPVLTSELSFESWEGKPITTIPSGFSYNPQTGENYLNNTNIQYINLNQVQTIQEKAFKNANKIKSVKFNENMTSIEESAFEGCTSLIGITVPEKLTNIGAYAFKDCSGAYYLDLSHIDVEKLKSGEFTIGEGAFAGWKEEGGTIRYPANIEDDLKEIINQALSDAGLPDAWFGEKPSEPGAAADEVPTDYLVIDDNNVLQCINWPELESYCNGKSYSKLTLVIPSTVTEIADGFWSNGSYGGDKNELISGLKFKVGSSCQKIGSGAFDSAFTDPAKTTTPDLILPKSITEIKDDAFSICTGFTGTITFGSNLTSIGAKAFDKCGFVRYNFANISSDSFEEMYSKGQNPFGEISFGGRTKENTELIILPTYLNAAELSEYSQTFKQWLIAAGMPEDAFGQDTMKYETKITPYKQSDYVAAGVPIASDDISKQEIIELYIDAINNGLEQEKTFFTGQEVLINDLMTTAHNYMVDEWAEAAEYGVNVSNSIRISDVSISGPYVSFKMTGYINAVVYDMYMFNFEFSTTFTNLKIIGFNPDETLTSVNNHPIGKFTTGQTQLAFWGDDKTTITSEYDVAKLFVYNSSKDYWEKYGTGTNCGWEKYNSTVTGDVFDELTSYYDEGSYYVGEDGENLYAKTMQLFNSCPTLICSIFRIGSMTAPFNSALSGETSSVVYNPLCSIDTEASTPLYSKHHNFLCFTPTLISNAPVVSSINMVNGLENYIMSQMNFSTKKSELGTVTSQKALQDYWNWISSDLQSEKYSMNLYTDMIYGLSTLFNIRGKYRASNPLSENTKFEQWQESLLNLKVEVQSFGESEYRINNLSFAPRNRFTSSGMMWGTERNYECAEQTFDENAGNYTYFTFSDSVPLKFSCVKAFDLGEGVNRNCVCLKIASQADEFEDWQYLGWWQQTFISYYFPDGEGSPTYLYNIPGESTGASYKEFKSIMLMNGTEKLTKAQIEAKLKDYFPAFYFNKIFKVIEDPENQGNYEIVLIYPSSYLQNVVIND